MSVYLIEGVGSGTIKIGYAVNPARRIKVVATSCPFPVVVLACREGPQALERAMHRALADRRAHGEWFQHWPECVAWFHDFELPAFEPASGPLLSPTNSGVVDWYNPETLRLAIKERGYTPATFAEAVSLSRSQVYRLLSGAFKPHFATQARIEAALEATPKARAA